MADNDVADSPQLSELVSFLQTLPEPHILCDRNYRIIAANDAYRANWLDQQEVVGRKCYEVSHRYDVPCDQAGEFCPLQRSLRSGQRERVLHLHHTPQGESFENIELSPIRDASGEIVYYIEKLEPLPGARSQAHAQGLIGRSPAFVRMMEMVARVAPSDAAVLLQGESGTGKELVAGAIHRISKRADQPFVAVDCSGLPETLFESELFGHERGDDVLLLAEALLARVAAGRKLTLSAAAQAWLVGYPYPGNVRELRNLLERACLLCDGDEIQREHLPATENVEFSRSTAIFVQKPPPPDFATLARNFKGSRKALAQQLGLSERTLYRRLKMAGLL